MEVPQTLELLEHERLHCFGQRRMAHSSLAAAVPTYNLSAPDAIARSQIARLFVLMEKAFQVAGFA